MRTAPFVTHAFLGVWMFVWAPSLILVLVLVLVLVPGAATLLTAAQDATPTVWDGVYTEEQSERGSVTYRQACRKCHFADLSGAGDTGATPGEVAPGLVGDAFSWRWNELSVGDLFLAISRSMPSDRPGTLKPQATADVVSYILKRNAFPSGETELPADRQQLEKILITNQR